MKYIESNNHIEELFKNPWYQVLLNTFSSVISYTHDFYKEKKIKPVIFPITTGSISSPMGEGSDSLPVKVNIRGQDVFLADSMQFSLEIGTRLTEKGCYYIMPSFRGEDVDERHLNEFFHSEAEIKGNLNDVMKIIQEYILYLSTRFLSEYKDTITSICGVEHILELVNNPKNHFIQIPYKTALEELKSVNDAVSKDNFGNLIITKYGEKELIRRYGDFCWLTELPTKIVPFYQASEENDFETAKAADLLAGIGEVVGCGERCTSAQDLLKSLDFHKVSIDDYKWYYDMKNICPLQTAGFGMGIERFILWLYQHDDIRDCMLLIRNHKQLNFP